MRRLTGVWSYGLAAHSWRKRECLHAHQLVLMSLGVLAQATLMTMSACATTSSRGKRTSKAHGFVKLKMSLRTPSAGTRRASHACALARACTPTPAHYACRRGISANSTVFCQNQATVLCTAKVCLLLLFHSKIKTVTFTIIDCYVFNFWVFDCCIVLCKCSVFKPGVDCHRYFCKMLQYTQKVTVDLEPGKCYWVRNHNRLLPRT